MNSAKTNAIIATAYNLHIQQGEPMTPDRAAKLSRADRAALCRLLETKGGSDLYTADDAREAFAAVVSRPGTSAPCRVSVGRYDS
jgi:hypothetical protein